LNSLSHMPTIVDIATGREVKSKNPPKTNNKLVLYEPGKKPGPKKKNNNNRQPRRGGRGRRRRQNQPLQATTSVSVPLSTTSTVPQSFFRQYGAPKHKDYGVGVRYTGCSYFGTLSTFTGFSNAFTYSYQDVADITNINTDWDNVVCMVHPYNILRLNNEVKNWQRYCIREARIHYVPQCASSTSGSFTYNLIRDPTFIINAGTTTASYANIINTTPSSTQSPWLQSSIKNSAWETDRTWTTDYPLFVTGSVSSGQTGLLLTFIESSMQFLFAARWSSTNLTTADYGLFYIEYVVDFYGPKYSSVGYNRPYTFNSTTGLFSQSTTGSSSSDSAPLKTSDDVDKTELKFNFGRPESSLTGYRDALLPKPEKVIPKVDPKDSWMSLGRTHDSSRRDTVSDLKSDKALPRAGLVRTPSSEEVTTRSRVALYSGATDCPCCGHWPCKKDRSSFNRED